MLPQLSKASQTVIIVNQERAQEGVKTFVQRTKKLPSLPIIRKINLPWNVIPCCSRHIVFCPVMTEKDRVTISCIESTSILFRSVGTRNWLYGIRMHLPFFECPIKCPCGTLRSHIIMHCIVFHPLIAIFQHSWITALLLVHATTKHNPRYVPQQGHNRRCRRRSCICVPAIQFAHSLRGRSVEKDSLVCSEEGLECTSHSE